jgi:hypothetical protein
MSWFARLKEAAASVSSAAVATVNELSSSFSLDNMQARAGQPEPCAGRSSRNMVTRTHPPTFVLVVRRRTNSVIPPGAKRCGRGWISPISPRA